MRPQDDDADEEVHAVHTPPSPAPDPTASGSPAEGRHPLPAPENGHDLVVVANRLAVDRTTEEEGNSTWKRSPGGLVTALAPLMAQQAGAWVGWAGATGEELEPFEHEGIHLVPVELSAQEVQDYYEGFSNGTLWPLYHDVIAPPEYHRPWWEVYRRVNQRFAEHAAATAAEGATVWVQDYQLQLVPALLRELRPDVRIGFFNHIPFPPREIFAQLPWRREVLQGLLGADLLGFQRSGDAENFQRCVARFLGVEFTQGQASIGSRTVQAQAFPISIDTAGLMELAAQASVQERARAIREELGNPRRVLLGVDRLDYTKGIAQRIKAYAELLDEGRVSAEDACLVQVASPSRERVESYRELREEIELSVGRANGIHDTIGHTAIRYLYHAYPFEEMVALYLAADVMLVTSLRDGMNLVAKEYVAVRGAVEQPSGVLVLSEFTGAADQLTEALQVNAHDIETLKETIMTALEMDASEAGERMEAMIAQVREHDVQRWSGDFLDQLERATTAAASTPSDGARS